MSTFVLIEKYTVGAGGASSVTLGSGATIPQTYTDLVVKMSSRLDSNNSNSWYDILVTFNGSSTNYSGKLLYGTGSSAGSQSEATTYYPARTDSSLATASTFGNNEIYIPNYTSSNYKSLSHDGVTENNATAALTSLGAGLWSNTAAITSVTLTTASGKFVQYSTFYLYGILKA